MGAFLTAWGTTIGLLAAIGAQNAFVIESAIRKQHIQWVALTCILSDFVMITSGFMGLSQILKAHPNAQIWMGWIGVVFLLYYGALKLRDAFKAQSLDRQNYASLSVSGSITKTLAFTWLNPHVYLDTVILIPALALQHEDQNRIFAATGGYLGVVTWFVGVSIAGVLSSQLFQNARSWKILNLMTSVIMFWVAYHILTSLIFA